MPSDLRGQTKTAASTIITTTASRGRPQWTSLINLLVAAAFSPPSNNSAYLPSASSLFSAINANANPSITTSGVLEGGPPRHGMNNIPTTLFKRSYATRAREKLDVFCSPASKVLPASEKWKKRFTFRDAEFFISRARWTQMKLTEALDSERGTLSPYPSAFLSAALCTQLISEEERMMAVVDGSRTSTPDNLIRTVVAHIIHAQYCNGNAAAKVRERVLH